MYGTAWKEERTEALVTKALAAGFTAIDTANQRRHYFEEGVGEALKKHFAAGGARADLFLQSKFTYPRGQDHRLPYDPKAPAAEQVAQSFANSLEHLGTDYLDSLVLHGPSTGHGLSKVDLEVWRAMEALQRGGKARHIGVSNVSFEQLALLWRSAEVKPTFVQNRCYARRLVHARVVGEWMSFTTALSAGATMLLNTLVGLLLLSPRKFLNSRIPNSLAAIVAYPTRELRGGSSLRTRWMGNYSCR